MKAKLFNCKSKRGKIIELIIGVFFLLISLPFFLIEIFHAMAYKILDKLEVVELKIIQKLCKLKNID